MYYFADTIAFLDVHKSTYWMLCTLEYKARNTVEAVETFPICKGVSRLGAQSITVQTFPGPKSEFKDNGQASLTDGRDQVKRVERGMLLLNRIVSWIMNSWMLGCYDVYELAHLDSERKTT